ncbi:MAG: molecular chaperone SurA [Betaproteobacteria bacterium]|nr:molecular chaperone SurA [Betaproteobacteria bacterium]
MATVLLTVALVLLAAAPAQAQRISLVDRIAAVVNREVVTYTELRERLGSTERELRRQGTPLPDAALLERQLLERLILEKLQLELARESGIRIDEIQLDRAIERVAQGNNLSLADFRRALERDGIDFERFREEVRSQIMLTRLREREVDDRIQVNDTEIDLYLAENKDGDGRSGEYNLAHILVRLPEQAAPERIEQARAKAEKARAEAVAGGDFARLAASYSDGADALQGGAMGWRAEDRLPELFSATLKRMRPGAVSEVLRSPAGFHVLKLIESRNAGADEPVMQTRVRHILVRTNEVVSEAEARRKLADLRERMVIGKQDFASLARQHSEDGTASLGGILDWVFPGDTVPEFERAMNELKLGEISQPVKSTFGWHLIEVLERRNAGLTPERKRLQARQVLRGRKADEAFQEWLRQLRDRAFVEIRLDQF